jgi:dienelactone hydrolase
MIFILITTILVIWLLWYILRNNRRIFMRRIDVPCEVHTTIVSRDDKFCIEHFEIHSPRKFTLNGYLKIPEHRNEKMPVILLLSGLFTGKDTIELLKETPKIEPHIVVTVDYPYKGNKRLKWWQILQALPKIRKAAFNSVFGLFDLIEMLSGRTEADSERIHIAGVSFGSFFGMAAAACDNRIKSVASLYGGGKIEKLVATNLPFQIPIINQCIGMLTKLIVYPLEPLHYVQHISPRPLLVMGGSEDKQFPKACAHALFNKAKEPKDLVWFKSSHPLPDRADIINDMTNVLSGWMVDKGLLRRHESTANDSN